jgi:hypothetical protein
MFYDSDSSCVYAVQERVPLGPRLAAVIMEDMLTGDAGIMREIAMKQIRLAIGMGIVVDEALEGDGETQNIMSRLLMGTEVDMRRNACEVVGTLADGAVHVGREVARYVTSKDLVEVRVNVIRTSVDDTLYICVVATLHKGMPSNSMEYRGGIRELNTTSEQVEGAPARKEQDDVEETP